MAATASLPQFPAQVSNLDRTVLYVRHGLEPDRRRVLTESGSTACARSETLTKLLLRALAREVARCRAELAHGTVTDRLTVGDAAEEELLKMFAGEDLGLLL